MPWSLDSLFISTDQFDGLVQERRNSSALAMKLHLSCTNPSKLSIPWRSEYVFAFCFMQGALMKIVDSFCQKGQHFANSPVWLVVITLHWQPWCWNNSPEILNEKFLVHCCISLRQSESYMVQIMACHLVCTKPLSQPVLDYCKLNPWEQISITFW